MFKSRALFYLLVSATYHGVTVELLSGEAGVGCGSMEVIGHFGLDDHCHFGFVEEVSLYLKTDFCGCRQEDITSL